MRPIQYFLVAAGLGLLVTFYLPGGDAPARQPAELVAAAASTVEPAAAPARAMPAATPRVDSPRPQGLTADPRRDESAPTDLRVELTARLESSGTAPAAFHHDVERIVDGWVTSLPADLRGNVELGPTRCYHGGCSIETISRDAITNEEIGHALSSSQAFIDFKGWRARTGAEVGADGRVTARWFFLAPEAS
jgi:hypothetical protein